MRERPTSIQKGTKNHDHDGIAAHVIQVKQTACKVWPEGKLKRSRGATVRMRFGLS